MKATIAKAKIFDFYFNVANSSDKLAVPLPATRCLGPLLNQWSEHFLAGFLLSNTSYSTASSSIFFGFDFVVSIIIINVIWFLGLVHFVLNFIFVFLWLDNQWPGNNLYSYIVPLCVWVCVPASVWELWQPVQRVYATRIFISCWFHSIAKAHPLTVQSAHHQLSSTVLNKCEINTKCVVALLSLPLSNVTSFPLSISLSHSLSPYLSSHPRQFHFISCFVPIHSHWVFSICLEICKVLLGHCWTNTFLVRYFISYKG